MQSAALLEEIWTGNLRPAGSDATAELAAMLDAFLPVRLLALDHHCLARPLLLPDSAELLPDLPLGDVLVEEMGLEVPTGTLVLVADVGGQSSTSRLAGEAMGDLLERLVGWAELPVTQETEALVRLARASLARGHQLAGHLPGFDALDFGEGLAAALGRFWAGDAMAPIQGADFLDRDEVTRYLRALDPAFSGQPAAAVPDLLLQPMSLSRRFEDWAAAVAGALRRHLGTAPTAA
ncbi:hypothetical protein [Frigidibacter sp. MR17.24]|uniref:hypothetical protein n=1 Tax=Frigidibacter sp. MR17.24 TaxID=3127345 RepID=UPI00301315F2